LPEVAVYNLVMLFDQALQLACNVHTVFGEVDTVGIGLARRR
jgi:hypothetical protein